MGIAWLQGLRDDTLAESIARGKEVYENYCIACHQADGKGLPGNFPPLAGSDFLTKYPERSLYAAKYGMQGEIVVNGQTYNLYMASLNLDHEEVADVMNYVRNSWGNKNDTLVTIERVVAIKK